MKTSYLFFLLIILLTACQVTSEPDEENTPEVTLTKQLEATATAAAAVTAPVSPATAIPTITNTATPLALQPSAAAQEEFTPTASPSATSLPHSRPATDLGLIQRFDGLIEPVYLTHAGDERLFIVEKGGRIRVAQDGQLDPDPFLDISGRILSSGYEQGLLSVAFHPQYAENGYIYVNYTDLGGRTTIARYQRAGTSADRADAGSELILMQVAQPYVNHNGGQLQFGPDGYLYIGLGDGGSAGDPESRAQDGTTYLGKLLRIDVDHGDPYSLPADNPYLGMSSRRNEIWASGLRNPWRFSFDRQTGDLYIADVGQNLWEEINFQPARSSGGENYGWNVMEAAYCYGRATCDQNGLVLPIGEYPHEDGNCSVTGGYVYRGSVAPEMTGNYLFGDYCSGSFWRLFQSQDGSWTQAKIADSDLFISSFGEDAAGELYVLDLIGGIVYQLQLY